MMILHFGVINLPTDAEMLAFQIAKYREIALTTTDEDRKRYALKTLREIDHTNKSGLCKPFSQSAKKFFLGFHGIMGKNTPSVSTGLGFN